MKKFLTAVSAVAIIGFGITTFHDITYAEKSLQEVKEERSQIKKSLSDAESQVADILIELKELEKEIAAVNYSLNQNEKMLNEIKNDIRVTEEESEQLQKEIEELEANIEKRFNILKDRVSTYQKTGGAVSYLEVIFGSKSFGDFISRVSAVNKIADSDARLIEKQEEDKRKVEEKQEELQNKLEELTGMQQELEEMNQLIREQKQQVESQKEALKAKETELNNKIKSLKMKDSELKALENKLKLPKVQTLSYSSNTKTSSSNGGSSSSAPAGSGVFAWPTSGGYVSSYMGPRWNSQHKGIDIARTNRSVVPPIFAAADGVVESAGYNSGGYGNRIVIRHANGLKTVYAHLSSISVKPGQKVSRGQKIGVMGATGNSTGIHLHFEVYKNGALQNPLDYL